ncbi:hypothetical protein [Mucilaginibacter paludis]|uniref:Uncharacterized protein n=1 Tax=Mucilaginibacter paludis DSM 18603 TaxID=714943 RepID=H1Y2H0_9SPHI|nr:hypothetical protein [Mucilaginibacter paludis]EHQ28018.1 hypothetical protein Mucpa_3927 [Mucilaginibacter paludis DSM 18603]
MKTLCLLLFVFLGFKFSAFAQEDFNFSKHSIEEIQQFENTKHSTFLTTLPDFGILKDPMHSVFEMKKSKALIFKRTDDDFVPQLHLWYYFDQKTNGLVGVLYNWGFFNPDFNPTKERKKLEKLTRKEPAFVAKFDSLQNHLTKSLGQPVKVETIADNEANLIKEVYWDDDDKVVTLSINFPRKLHEIRGLIFSRCEIQIMTTFK